MQGGPPPPVQLCAAFPGHCSPTPSPCSAPERQPHCPQQVCGPANFFGVCTHLSSAAPYRPSTREGQVEEGVSVAAPRGDMDGSRSRVTDISESCGEERAFRGADGVWTPLQWLIPAPRLMFYLHLGHPPLQRQARPTSQPPSNLSQPEALACPSPGCGLCLASGGTCNSCTPRREQGPHRSQRRLCRHAVLEPRL